MGVASSKKTSVEKVTKKKAATVATKATKAGAATRKTVAAKGSARPKKPLSAYMLWLQEKRPEIVASLQKKDQKDVTLVAKAAGALWNKATARTKSPYEKKSGSAMKKYKKAMDKYEAQPA